MFLNQTGESAKHNATLNKRVRVEKDKYYLGSNLGLIGMHLNFKTFLLSVFNRWLYNVIILARGVKTVIDGSL